MVFRIIMNDAGTITITASFTSWVRLDDGGDDGACRGCWIRHLVAHNGLGLGGISIHTNGCILYPLLRGC